MNKIFVLGSINVDYRMSVDRMPTVGESKLGYGFGMGQGGKGANQAIACNRLGCDNVYFIGCVGNDENGNYLKRTVGSYGVDVSAVDTANNVVSGACLIILDDSQQDNYLVVDKGANMHVSAENVKTFLLTNATKGDVFITQLETNLDAVQTGLQTAKQIGMYTILNPAPMCQFDKQLLTYVDLLVPNQTELQLLSNTQDVAIAYNSLASYGIALLVTLGENGSVYVDSHQTITCPAVKTTVVDTTCAGDTFIGAIALEKACGTQVYDAMPFAAQCSAITISRKGAGESVPNREEINQILQSRR